MKPLMRRLVRHVIRAVDGDAGLSRLESMAVRDTGFGYDRFGCERESFWAGYLAARQLYRRWFRVRSSGHEHVPPTGRVILAANHSGLLPFDGAMISTDLVERLDPPRALRAIVDHFAFDMPYVGVFMLRTGQVPGTARNFADLLAEEAAVLVFPEGTPGFIKPYRERYKLRRFRVGFVELAIEQEAPIVPVAVVGAEEQAPVLFSIKALGRPLGLPAFPVTPTFPLLGPLGLIPLPSRYTILYGEPIWPHREVSRAAAGDPEALRVIAERVQARVAELIHRGRALRAGEPDPGDASRPAANGGATPAATQATARGAGASQPAAPIAAAEVTK